MTYLEETDEWEEGIYQIETHDPVLGGPGGIVNLPATQLARRTRHLKKKLENLEMNGGSLNIGIATEDRPGTLLSDPRLGKVSIDPETGLPTANGLAEAIAAIVEIKKNTPGWVEFWESGVFIVPDDFPVDADGYGDLLVTGCGGGAGGNRGDVAGGGGGGADAIFRKVYRVKPGDVIPITIGKGGAPGAGTMGSVPGQPGGATIIGSLVTLPGGTALNPGGPGGGASRMPGITGGGGEGNSGGGGSLGGGGASFGIGGESFFGNGGDEGENGQSPSGGLSGYAGSNPGGGGGGPGGGGAGSRNASNGVQAAGGFGGSGYCLFEWGAPSFGGPFEDAT